MLLKSEIEKKNLYRPKEVAKMLGCTSKTVTNYADNNKFDVVRTDSNFRYITKESLIKFLDRKNMLVDDTNSRKNVIYARVSTHRQKERGDLDRQVEYIYKYIMKNKIDGISIIKEVGSGLNDNRKQLLKLIDSIMNNEIENIYILYKDRLTRFGYNYIDAICKKFNTKVIVVSNEEEDKTIQEELAEDIISIIHSFSGKLYGMRKRISEELEKGDK